jgi:hypothetical protein
VTKKEYDSLPANLAVMGENTPNDELRPDAVRSDIEDTGGGTFRQTDVAIADLSVIRTVTGYFPYIAGVDAIAYIEHPELSLSQLNVFNVALAKVVAKIAAATEFNEHDFELMSDSQFPEIFDRFSETDASPESKVKAEARPVWHMLQIEMEHRGYTIKFRRKQGELWKVWASKLNVRP